MERYYRFADITFRITGPEDMMFRDDGVLGSFRVAADTYDHTVCYEVADVLPKPEGECVFRGGGIQVFRQGDLQTVCMGMASLLPEGAHTHIYRQETQTRVCVTRDQVPEGIKPRLVLNTLEAEHHVVRHGGFLLHACTVLWEGKAILFTAPSGTGKSTQGELWKRYRGAEIINGDRTVVKITPDGPKVYGIPYCGTSGISRSGEYPLAAIVYLTQAPQTSVRPLTGLRAFRSLWEGCSVNMWDRDDVDLCSSTVMEAACRVPVVHLACTPDETAVQMLEAYLKRES